MKKRFFLLLLPGLWACSAGVLEIDTIDFNQESIQVCGNPSTATEVLFKLKGPETLILELQPGLLLNEASSDTLTSAVPGQSQLIYRLLSDQATTGYFCDPIPPVSPTVVEEILAADGTVQVFTTRNPSDTTQFEHTIRLKGISFVNDSGERLTNLEVDEFGTLVTTAN
ncbi:hypothetical protein [Robiginitalea marina]|uniref:Lipoprotein n=1 Tax=Robiginitalea marina TaxID=2954105 RepID=A0ABT1AVR5_9FLAO|nr:hypothetical protein [Robiginitalea marina]